MEMDWSDRRIGQTRRQHQLKQPYQGKQKDISKHTSPKAVPGATPLNKEQETEATIQYGIQQNVMLCLKKCRIT